MTQLTQFLTDALQECVKRGMRLPYVVCCVAKNHSVVVTRLDGDAAPDVLAEHLEDDRFLLPINMMVVSQDNKVARVIVDASGGNVSTTFH